MLKEILLITPSINMGGMQKAMVTLANDFVAEGIDTSMYALFNHEHFFSLHPKIHFSEANCSINKVSALRRIISVIFNVRRKLKSYSGDVVIVYGKFYSALVLLANIGLKRKIFISDRASPFYKDFWYVEFLTSLIYRFCKPYGIIAQTSDSAQYQKKRFGDEVPIKIIPNSVGVVNRRNVEREKIVLAVGRFKDPLKGFDRLIEAWCQVKKEDWKLYFVGGSESEEPYFIKRLQEEGIRNSVCFWGKQNDMSNFYSRSSIFVIPSRSEGFPNALIEAMSYGCSCISFDFIAGPKDIIDNGYDGIIVPDGDIDLLANAITQLIHSPKMRSELSQHALLTSKRFDRRVIIKSIIDFVSC